MLRKRNKSIMAHAAVFLLFNQASYMIEIRLPVDGGISLRGG